MLSIGIIAANRTKKTTDDYILASREVGPLATALSAVSTCHSGFMFIGMIGFTYTIGISSMWMIFGWLVGDFIAWKWVYPKLRQSSEEQNNLTIPEFVTNHLPHNKKRMLQLIIATIIFIFVSLYAAAQLIAGSKALGIFINLPQEWGIILGGSVVLVYSVSGGIRASIWTDVIQSVIMMIAMIGLLITVLVTIGGVTPLFTMLTKIDPSLANPFTGFDFGLILYILGWCAFGLGVIGQPHILTRPMAIKSTKDLKKSRTIYLSWYMVFSAAAILIGLAARVLLPELINQDPELGLPLLALQYLPTFFVGIILAGIFSACISTADSQILVCSATITQTFLSNKKQSILASRATTLFTLIFIVLFSIFASKSVFFWVILAWSILALVLSPLVFSQCFNIKLSQKSIIAVITTSLLFIYWWIFKLELSPTVNEVLPGFIIITVIISLFKIAEKK
ncbi:MAG: sodium/proline symporter [Candidatus Margulisiibacteriota bacterium]|nr:sodium/proline symporter [Candidatus Margulisiibacteriota bacterium]